MTIVSRDGSAATLEAIAQLFPALAGGGYRGALLEAGGRDLLEALVLHGGECGDEPNRWDVSVWHEGDSWTKADVVVKRGHARHDFGQLDPDSDWGIEVKVSPARGRATTHFYPCSFRGYRRTDARAYVARALTAHLAAS